MDWEALGRRSATRLQNVLQCKNAPTGEHPAEAIPRIIWRSNVRHRNDITATDDGGSDG